MAILFITILSATLYICAAGLSIYQLKHHSRRFAAAARILFFTALLAQSVAIGITSVTTSGTLLQGPNILMLASWALAVIFAFFEMATGKSSGFGAFVIPVVVLMMLIAELMNAFTGGAALYNRVFNEWPLLAFHIGLFFIAIACFIISAVTSGLLLYQQHLARSKATDFLSTHLPAISTLKRIAGRAVLIGMPAFTAGILLGFYRYAVLFGTVASMGCGAALYLMPRIVLSVILWIVYCVYIVFVYLTPGRVSSKVCSWMSIIAGAATILLAVLSSVAVI